MSLLKSLFFKLQLVSLTSTAVDFSVTILLKEFAEVVYLAAHIVGLFSGGLTQFTLNRRWVFNSGERTNAMILKFIFVWMINFSLSTTSVWLLTNFFQWNYIFSKIITSTLLAVSINFFLQKEYVFK
ncbi:GtrA family protein [Chryseobacterium lathyri]|uniref:Flippase GtrA n=1 Tax=Chryseobacterium lathyri TaxID=395933 RepID=A0ABT9SQX9_9FLAO|nr:GtrA family protein [Chryseobacterium lathyri]MDP9961849.1 putative flippase GtrA [Chryseobacterium lathyri]MDQ0064214.1 putative flippase GtrA [Chryseobacterium lathyri]